MSALIRTLVEAVAAPDTAAARGHVDDAALTALLDAARAAPSGINGQTWRFVVVRAPARLDRLAGTVPAALREAVASASAAIVVCAIPGRISRKDLGIPFAAIDVPNALTHLLLAVAERQLPCSWTLDVVQDACRRELAIPDDVRVTAVVAY
ncbi:MAG: nitroreductase family protein [Actinomycetota bacterium]